MHGEPEVGTKFIGCFKTNPQTGQIFSEQKQDLDGKSLQDCAEGCIGLANIDPSRVMYMGYLGGSRCTCGYEDENYAEFGQGVCTDGLPNDVYSVAVYQVGKTIFDFTCCHSISNF